MIDFIKDITLGDFIDQAATEFSDREALVFEDVRYTYKELRDKVDQLAKGFLKIGIQKGDKVAILMANRPEWIFTKFAGAKIGAVLVPVNTRFKEQEVEYILENSDSTTLVMTANFQKSDFIQIVRGICPEIEKSEEGNLVSAKLPFLKRVIVSSDRKYEGMHSFSDVMGMGAGDELNDDLRRVQSSVKADDIVYIQYTSGTTGFPKGTMHRHHMIGHHFLVGERGGCMPSDRMILFLPLFHVFGNAVAVFGAFTHGACLVLQESFDPEESLKLMVKEKCTYINCVPATVIMMLNHPNFPKYADKLTLKKGIIGGSPAPVQLVLDIVEKMGVKGISAGYGQTEGSGFTSYSVKGDSYETVASTIGKPNTDFDVKIVDTVTGETLLPGKEGELLIRGKAVMTGYYKMPEETAKVLDKDGWLRSGDLIVMNEDGDLKITGRVKDIYISGGENVAPAEVENFLFKHPKIKHVQIVGVPDERWGEVGVAFIELKDGETATEDEIISYCKEKIAGFKVPKHIRFVKEFPLTASGKIQKFQLKESFLKEEK